MVPPMVRFVPAFFAGQAPNAVKRPAHASRSARGVLHLKTADFAATRFAAPKGSPAASPRANATTRAAFLVVWRGRDEVRASVAARPLDEPQLFVVMKQEQPEHACHDHANVQPEDGKQRAWNDAVGKDHVQQRAHGHGRGADQ